MTPTNNGAGCVTPCFEEIELYESHYYNRKVTKVQGYGSINGGCAVVYERVGATDGVIKEDYEQQNRGYMRKTAEHGHRGVAWCLATAEIAPPTTHPTPHLADVLSVDRCSWSGREYPYPFWNGTKGRAMMDTIRALNAASVTYILYEGALIGAWRHGGPTPCDGDMDIIFPVWMNGLADCQIQTQMPPLSADGPESTWTLCGKTRDEYVSITTRWLRERFPTALISPGPYGGMRVNFVPGMGVDWVVSIDGFVGRNPDLTLATNGPICRAAFGDVEALTMEGAERMLVAHYGPTVGTPDAKVKRCLKTDASLVETTPDHHRPHFGNEKTAANFGTESVSPPSVQHSVPKSVRPYVFENQKHFQ